MKINFTRSNHWIQAEKIQIRVHQVKQTTHFIMLYQEKIAINLVWRPTKNLEWHIKYKLIMVQELKYTKENLIVYLNKQVQFLI